MSENEPLATLAEIFDIFAENLALHFSHLSANSNNNNNNNNNNSNNNNNNQQNNVNGSFTFHFNPSQVQQNVPQNQSIRDSMNFGIT